MNKNNRYMFVYSTESYLDGQIYEYVYGIVYTMQINLHIFIIKYYS